MPAISTVLLAFPAHSIHYNILTGIVEGIDIGVKQPLKVRVGNNNPWSNSKIVTSAKHPHL